MSATNRIDFPSTELKNDYEDAKDEVRKLENAVEQKEKDCSKVLSKAVQIEKDKSHGLLKEKCVVFQNFPFQT